MTPRRRGHLGPGDAQNQSTPRTRLHSGSDTHNQKIPRNPNPRFYSTWDRICPGNLILGITFFFFNSIQFIGCPSRPSGRLRSVRLLYTGVPASSLSDISRSHQELLPLLLQCSYASTRSPTNCSMSLLLSDLSWPSASV